MVNAKSVSTPIETNTSLDKDGSGIEVEVTQFQSIFGSLLYLMAYRQHISECICVQIHWFKQHFLDSDLKLYHTPIKYDNTIAINLTKNRVLHSKTKHIEIRRRFLLDRVKKGM